MMEDLVFHTNIAQAIGKGRAKTRNLEEHFSAGIGVNGSVMGCQHIVVVH